MVVANESFETPGSAAGEAASWTTADATAFVEAAEFTPGLGYERLEQDWRLSLGRNIEAGLVNVPKDWATITGGAPDFAAGTVPTDFVAGLVATVISGVVGGGAVVLTLIYTNELSVGGRTAMAVVPAGTPPGTEWPFTLEGTDKGFEEITGLAANSDPATIAIHGSWQLQPRNEAALFAFLLANLQIAQFAVLNNFDGFEFGWNNTGGIRDDFNAILSEAVSFDAAGTPEDFEDYEELWNMPQPVMAVTNESQIFAHENWIDSSIADDSIGVFVIQVDANDRVALSIAQGGTATPIVAQLDPGRYSLRAPNFKIPAASFITDGQFFELDDGDNTPVRFEFDDDSSVVPSAILRPIVFASTDDANKLRDAIVTAVNDPAITLDVNALSDANAEVNFQSTSSNFIAVPNATLPVELVITLSIVDELLDEIGDELFADGGTADDGDIGVTASPGDRIRITNLFPGGAGRVAMELLVSTNSAWGTLGFTPNRNTQRSLEIRNIDPALFDVADDPFEDFEEEWRSNEASISSLPDDANGVIAAVPFGGPAPNTPEQFETGWVLVLP